MTPLLARRVAHSVSALALSLLPALVLAASFSCVVARGPIEHAICGDAQLSALDEQLNETYRTALQGQGDSAEQLKADQRAWLKSLQMPTGQADPERLKTAYRDRIQALKDLPVFPSAGEPVEGPTFRLTDIAKQYDFMLRMLKPCPSASGQDDTTCEGAGQVLVYRKGQSKVMQTINMENIFVTFSKRGKPLANSTQLYEYQGAINVGDFNFDGNEDFGIQSGNNGSYGGPSYDIYLFDPKLGRFVYSDAMSDLIASTLGFFEVDPAHKLLRTMAKDGCCYHEFVSYQVEKNIPVSVLKHIEAMTTDGKRMEITDERLVSGKWQSKVHYEAVHD